LVVAGVLQVEPPTADRDDAHVFAAAVEGHAAYIVTNDKQMLALGVYQGARVVDASEFMRVLDDADPE
jgi:predicted nucleic acid-binding protein